MTPAQVILALTVDALIVSALVGLFVRRRSRVCYSFTTQLIFLLVTDLLMVFGGFYTRRFWMFQQVFTHFLTFAIALELTYKTFRAFPGARATARGVLLGVLFVVVGVTLAKLLSGWPGWASAAKVDDPMYQFLTGRVYPALLNGAIWLFTAVAALILWYRLPVDGFLKAILVGEVPYMLIFWVSLNALDAYGMKIARGYVMYSDPIAYLLLTAYWVYAAWRPLQAPVRPGEARVAAPVRRTA